MNTADLGLLFDYVQHGSMSYAQEFEYRRLRASNPFAYAIMKAICPKEKARVIIEGHGWDYFKFLTAEQQWRVLRSYHGHKETG